MVGRLVLVCAIVGCATNAMADRAASKATSARPVVCIAPLGPHDKRMLPILTRGIEHLFDLETRVLDPRELPRSAWYSPRKRYRAEKLLAYLDAEVIPDSGCDRVMGFTSKDISTTKGRHKDWGVLGLAWLGGPSGVVSTYRMRRKVSRRQKLMRAVKVVNHELGHTLGLEHGGGPGCLMEDARGTVKTVDRETGLLCDGARSAIREKNGFDTPALERFDWRLVLGGR